MKRNGGLEPKVQVSPSLSLSLGDSLPPRIGAIFLRVCSVSVSPPFVAAVSVSALAVAQRGDPQTGRQREGISIYLYISKYIIISGETETGTEKRQREEETPKRNNGISCPFCIWQKVPLPPLVSVGAPMGPQHRRRRHQKALRLGWGREETPSRPGALARLQ